MSESDLHPVVQINDPNRGEKRGYIRDKKLASDLARQTDNLGQLELDQLEKIEVKSYESSGKIGSGFKGQAERLSQIITDPQSTFSEQLKQFMANAEVGKDGVIRLIDTLPYPSEGELAKLQQQLSLEDFKQVISLLGGEAKTGMFKYTGKWVDYRDNKLDYITVTFPDMPNLGVNIGIIPEDGFATQKWNRDPGTAADILNRRGSKIYNLAFVPLPTPEPKKLPNYQL